MFQEILKTTGLLFLGLSGMMALIIFVLAQWLKAEKNEEAEKEPAIKMNWKGFLILEAQILLISVAGGIGATPFFTKHGYLTILMFVVIYFTISRKNLKKTIKKFFERRL